MQPRNTIAIIGRPNIRRTPLPRFLHFCPLFSLEQIVKEIEGFDISLAINQFDLPSWHRASLLRNADP